MTDPHHPAYGLPSNYRQEVLAALEHLSVAQAAEQFNLGESTIRRWKKVISHETS